MKLAIFGSYCYIPTEVFPLIDDNNPDIVIVFGGDGTILRSEQRYPSIPKLTFRDSEHGTKCTYDSGIASEILNHIISGKYTNRMQEEPKLEAYYNGITLHALNEIQIHNKNPQQAIRFQLLIDGKPSYSVKEIIGDGILICTPFGSSGYYKSITGKSIDKNHIIGDSSKLMGFALNNPYNIHDFKYGTTPITSEITIDITRGDGWLLADNNDFMIPVTTGVHITIKKSMQTAKFIVVNGVKL